jgi:2-dehydropantoate 2-reductase
VTAVAHPSEIAFREDDCVLLATKTQDTSRALDDLRQAAGSGIAVLCLQNGIESARLALRRFARTGATMTMLPSAHLQPGIVQAFSAPVAGVLDIGCFPNGDDALWAGVSADLRRAGFDSNVRPDVARWQYGKLLDNLKNALQALCGPEADYGDVFQALRSEAEACYRAAGIAYVGEPELRARVRGVLSLGKIGGHARPGDSSWQSLARSTGSIETDYLNGEIVLLGRLYGVPTPLNARLQEIANRCAREQRPPASMSIAELRKILQWPN